MGRHRNSQRPPANLDSGGRNHRYYALAVCVLLLVAVALVYGQTRDFGFVNYDDNMYVYENPRVKDGLTATAITSAFEHHAANWHPLTWLSLALDCQFYGAKVDRAGGHHLTNVLLHGAAAIVLFLAFWQMTGGLWPSALVAAIFAVHPLHVESVAWVTERKDVLSGLFLMLTLAAYVGYVHRRQASLVVPPSGGQFVVPPSGGSAGNLPAKAVTTNLWYGAVVVFYALGLMAKPMLVTLPFLLWLLDYWPLGRIAIKPQPVVARSEADNDRGPRTKATAGRGIVLDKLPLLAMAAVSCTATVWAQTGQIDINQDLSMLTRIGNAIVAYVAYLVQFFYPVELAVFYPHPLGSLAVPKVLAAGLVLLALSIGALACWRRCPYLLVGWLWYLGALVPVVGLVQVGRQAMADRYTYLPYIGLSIALVWGAADLCRKAGQVANLPDPGPTGNLPHDRRRRVYVSAAMLAVAALIGCAWRQTTFWRSSETLFTHTLACTSNNFLAHLNLSQSMLKSGNLDGAIAHCRRAVEILPDYADAYSNLGNALTQRALRDDQPGQLAEALIHCQRAVKLGPNSPEAHVNLATVFLQRNELERAAAEYRRALDIKPDCVPAHDNLGVVFARQHNLPEAIKQFETALRYKSDDLVAHELLADALLEESRVGEAIPHLERAASAKPALLMTLATVFAEQRRFADAAATARKALKWAATQHNPSLTQAIEAAIADFDAGRPFQGRPPQQ
jgi:protein O-mannosyl-transferase